MAGLFRVFATANLYFALWIGSAIRRAKRVRIGKPDLFRAAPPPRRPLGIRMAYIFDQWQYPA